MLYLGMDEVGYGPRLGPLVIGLSAVRLRDPPAASEADPVRSRLRGLVCRARRGPRSRVPIPIDDSKRLMSRGGKAALARAVGCFSAAREQPPPADLADLLRRHSDTLPESFDEAPWFQDLTRARVPGYPWPGPLLRSFNERGVEALDLRVLPVDAGSLNRSFASANKAVVLAVHTGMLLTSFLDRFPAEDVHVVVDRHGGRRNYLPLLAQWFPFASIGLMAQRQDLSRYQVRLPTQHLSLEFRTAADASDLMVGWASDVAKLTRELFMDCLNAWFQRLKPGLLPTAGYAVDGRRFERDVADLLGPRGIDPLILVRTR